MLLVAPVRLRYVFLQGEQKRPESVDGRFDKLRRWPTKPRRPILRLTKRHLNPTITQLDHLTNNPDGNGNRCHSPINDGPSPYSPINDNDSHTGPNTTGTATSSDSTTIITVSHRRNGDTKPRRIDTLTTQPPSRSRAHRIQDSKRGGHQQPTDHESSNSHLQTKVRIDQRIVQFDFAHVQHSSDPPPSVFVVLIKQNHTEFRTPDEPIFPVSVVSDELAGCRH